MFRLGLISTQKMTPKTPQKSEIYDVQNGTCMYQGLECNRVAYYFQYHSTKKIGVTHIKAKNQHFAQLVKF